MTAEVTAVHYSPEMQRHMKGRHHLAPSEARAEGQRGFLSASLPGVMSNGDLATIVNREKKTVPPPTSPKRSLSVRDVRQRPRSASVTQSTGTRSLRRSIRFTRSRPSSARGGIRGTKRWKSQTDADGPDASTEYMDATLARIHQQLVRTRVGGLSFWVSCFERHNSIHLYVRENSVFSYTIPIVK